MKSEKSMQEYKNEFRRQKYKCIQVLFSCDDCTINDLEEWCKSNKMSKNEFIKKAIKQALRIGLEN